MLPNLVICCGELGGLKFTSFCTCVRNVYPVNPYSCSERLSFNVLDSSRVIETFKTFPVMTNLLQTFLQRTRIRP